MPEALSAVMDYLFDVVGLNRVAACHDVDNPRSDLYKRIHKGLKQSGSSNAHRRAATQARQEHIVRTISVADGIVGVCLFTVLLVPRFGMMGVWVGQLLGCAFCVLLILIFACWYNRKLPISLDRLMCFPENFGVPEENRIDITARSLDEVVNLSRRIWDFCETHSIPERRKNYASLCTEELAGNIVLHGFRDNKKHSIDIRVSCVNEEVIVCFKDDGVPFNPQEAAQLFDDEDKGLHAGGNAFHNIGLRLVSRIAGSMTYQNMFGLNILTIVL